jgi:calcineurin-like phosphoesterase family protein
MGKDYFAADFHLGHANIIKYDNRPFRSVKEMDDQIMLNCERLFKDGDRFYFLGDFAFKNEGAAENYMKRLANTGVKMFFIKGNHDKSPTVRLYKTYGEYLGEQKMVEVQGQEIVLNHYRMDVWDKSHHGTWHLHGHSHHSLPERHNARCIDVGINGRGYNYSPLEFADIERMMAKKTWEPIDHHGRK